jgi:hypothetical protein
MTALPQALEITFEVQTKKSNEKITRKEKLFQLTKHNFVLTSFLGPLLFSNLITFFIFYSF